MPTSLPEPRCKDCVALAELRGQLLKVWRPCPFPGPRCASHAREFKRASKLKQRTARVKRVYSMGDGDYEALKAFQGGRCAICQRATGASKALAVDHDHETGEVRGLLCKKCNYDLLGHYNLAALIRACRYILDPPAPRSIGVRIVRNSNDRGKIAGWDNKVEQEPGGET